MISYDFHYKVYYKDVDQMGIVYYTRYFEMFEMARTELLNNIGIKVADVEKNGIFLPVVSASCDYKKTASFEQELSIKTSISTLPKARLDIEYSVHLKKDLSLIALGFTRHGFVDKNGKPNKPPAFLLNIFNTFFDKDKETI
tara:strand:- start:119 stop:544 length:426 start_codon:yes stop_codon:yes gene_type:complete